MDVEGQEVVKISNTSSPLHTLIHSAQTSSMSHIQYKFRFHILTRVRDHSLNCFSQSSNLSFSIYSLKSFALLSISRSSNLSFFGFFFFFPIPPSYPIEVNHSISALQFFSSFTLPYFPLTVSPFPLLFLYLPAVHHRHPHPTPPHPHTSIWINSTGTGLGRGILLHSLIYLSSNTYSYIKYS